MIRIKNWDSFQSYKDRKPPWIRFHKSILDNFEYQSMSADARALLPMLWLLASENDDPKSGVIESGISKISFRLRLLESTVKSSLDEIEAAGFIEQYQSCNESVTKPSQISTIFVTPETEKETDTETEKDIVELKTLDRSEIRKLIIDYLNEKAGKNFNEQAAATKKHLNARLDEGYSMEDFKDAIDNQCRAWIGTAWEKYLRPATLFNSEKFDGYVNATNSTNERLSNLSSSEQARVVLENWGSHVDSERSEDRNAEIKLIEIKECANG